jgi:hypothetical protein
VVVVVDDDVVVDDEVVVEELVVGGRVVVVVGRDVVVVELVVELVVDDDVTVVAGGLSSSDDRSAKMINTTATATMRMASAQKIGLLIALRSEGGGAPVYGGSEGADAGGTGSPMFGSVGVGSTAGMACVGSSAPGRPSSRGSPLGGLPLGVSLMPRAPLSSCSPARLAVREGRPADAARPENLEKTRRDSTSGRGLVQGCDLLLQTTTEAT